MAGGTLDAAGGGDSDGVVNPDDSEVNASCDSNSMAESYLLDASLDEVCRVKAIGRNGPVATSGMGRADSEEFQGMAIPRMSAFEVVVFFQILLVELYCLPLVLPSRVSPTVSLTWEKMFFIKFFHRWRSKRSCLLISSLLLHYIKSSFIASVYFAIGSWLG